MAKATTKTAKKKRPKAESKSGSKAKPKAKSTAKPKKGASAKKPQVAAKSAKKAAPKASTKSAAAKPTKTVSKKTASAKSATSSKSAAASNQKPNQKETSKKSVGTVAQVANALKSVATKVTNALSTVTGDTKKKAKNADLDITSVFTPLDDRLLVERNGVSNRTAGGLYIPDTVSDSEKPNHGVVLAVGPGHRNKKGQLRPLDVQQGNKVIFSKWAGSEINLEGRDLVLIRESDVVAIVNE